MHDFVLGNVRHGGYRDGLRSPAMRRLWPAVAAGIEACERECAYFAYCGGGAPANKWFENGDFASTETLYCRSMLQRPFDAVLARLERERTRGRENGRHRAQTALRGVIMTHRSMA